MLCEMIQPKVYKEYINWLMGPIWDQDKTIPDIIEHIHKRDNNINELIHKFRTDNGPFHIVHNDNIEDVVTKRLVVYFCRDYVVDYPTILLVSAIAK
jgi:hypothetical protein